MSLYATYALPSTATPASSAAPVISGSAQVGQTLGASTGSWSGSPSSYGYQWQRCDASGNGCTAISGATSPSYTVAGADAGSTVEVAVSAFNAGGAATASSAPTGVVPQVLPSNTSAPTISGSALVGSTLAASAGSWSGTTPTYSYQWERCAASGNGCIAIAGATQALTAFDSALAQLASGSPATILQNAQQNLQAVASQGT